jgi:hypothetical protein
MRLTLPLLAAVLVAAPPARAQGTVSFGADPATLAVGQAAAGFAPEPAEAPSSYTLAGVAAPSRLTARLGTPLPAGVTLWLAAEAPAGAVSRGAVALGTADAEVVAGIPAGDHPSLSLTYTLRATAAAGTVPPTAVDVVFTLVPQGS